MYRICASDMDETFIARDYGVHPDNLKAIDEMEAAGCMFVVATGRPYSSVQDTLELVGHKGRHDRFCITYNGGYVVRCDGEVLVRHAMDMDVMDELYRYGQEHGLCIHVYGESGCSIANMTDAERRYLVGRMDVDSCDGMLPSELGEAMFKILFHSTDMDELRAIEADLRKRYPQMLAGLETTYSANRYLEFNPAGVNKGRALLELAEALEIDAADTMAVGDSANDLAMLLDAGLGLAVANRSDDVAAALGLDRTLSRDCDEGALWEVWERFVKPSIDD